MLSFLDVYPSLVCRRDGRDRHRHIDIVGATGREKQPVCVQEHQLQHTEVLLSIKN